MVRIPEPKGISVRVLEISGQHNGEPYQNRIIWVPKFEYPKISVQIFG